MTPESSKALDAARQEAVEVVEALAHGIRDLLGAPSWDPPIRTVKDIQNATRLSHRVAWQLHRVGGAEDALGEVRHLPKRPAFERLCEVAGAGGAPASTVDRAVRAFDAYERATREIAGDREAFAEMADAWCGKRSAESAGPYLRQAYRANRQIWGIAAKASFVTGIALPSPAKWVLLRGLCSLRSYRSRAWDVCTSRHDGVDDAQPLEIARADGTHLIPEYCRGPIPEMDHRSEGGLRFVRAKFEVSGAVTPHTLVFGERTSPHERDGLKVTLSSAFPTERMRIDLLAHRDFAPRLVERQLFSGFAAGSRELEAVPIDVQQRASAAGAASFREFSSYGALLEEVLALDGHVLDDFALFRASCEYPPTGGVLAMGMEFDHPDGTR